MLSYEECKKAALKKAEECGIELDTAYSIGQDFPKYGRAFRIYQLFTTRPTTFLIHTTSVI